MHAVAPKANAEWWRSKLEANVARDRRNDATLRDSDWDVIRIWEHENPATVADGIETLWRDRIRERCI
jgi:DNA mismatch endonuclease, patch repair protein